MSLIDTDSGATRVLGYFAPTGFEVSPSEFGWSADGSAVLTRNSLGDWLFPIDGSEPQARIQGCWPHCSPLSPSGVLRAWPGFAFPAKVPDSQPPITSKIVVARVDTGASVVWEREFNGFDFHWTSDGRRLLIAESGGQRDVIWSLDPASSEMEVVAQDVVLLGTLEELRQRSTSILPE